MFVCCLTHRVLNNMTAALLTALMVITLSPTLAQGASCSKPVPKQINWQSAETESHFPDTPFYSGNGDPITITDYRGQGVIINFWATWCAPCVREMPSLNSLQKNHGKALGLAVLPISLDRGGARQVDPFYAKNDLDELPVLIDDKRKLARAVGIGGLPTTVIVGRNGKELGRILGEADWHGDEMVDFLKACFEAE